MDRLENIANNSIVTEDFIRETNQNYMSDSWLNGAIPVPLVILAGALIGISGYVAGSDEGFRHGVAAARTAQIQSARRAVDARTELRTNYEKTANGNYVLRGTGARR